MSALFYQVSRQYIDWKVTKAKIQKSGVSVSGPRVVEMLGSITVNEAELTGCSSKLSEYDG